MNEEGFQDEEEEQTENASPVLEQNQEENFGGPKRAKRRFHIEVFRAWCKSCGICAAFCPRHCIELDDTGSPFVAALDSCSGCGWCELHCPDFAISVQQESGNENQECPQEKTG